MFNQTFCSILCILYMTARIGIVDIFPSSQNLLREMHKTLCMAWFMSDMQGHTLLKSEQILYSVKLLCKALLWGPFIK